MVQIKVGLGVVARKVPEVVQNAAYHHLPVWPHGELVAAQHDALAGAVKGEDGISQAAAGRNIDEVNLLLSGVATARVDQDGRFLAAGQPLRFGREVEVTRQLGLAFVGDIQEMHLSIQVLYAFAEVANRPLDGRQHPLVMANRALVEHELRRPDVVGHQESRARRE